MVVKANLIADKQRNLMHGNGNEQALASECPEMNTGIRFTTWNDMLTDAVIKLLKVNLYTKHTCTFRGGGGGEQLFLHPCTEHLNNRFF